MNLREIAWSYELDSTGSPWSPVVGSRKHNKGTFDSINCLEFEYLSDRQLLKKDRLHGVSEQQFLCY
jgi:hypothetical protein